MIREDRDWTEYRELPSLVEVDFHWSVFGRREVHYLEAMGEVYEMAFDALKKAYKDGMQYVLFTHGCSTSRPFQTTARSVVRGLMRSKEATPYIIRSHCIQHPTVFVAAIRGKKHSKKRIKKEKEAE